MVGGLLADRRAHECRWRVCLLVAAVLLGGVGCDAGRARRSEDAVENPAAANPVPAPARIDQPGERVVRFVLTDQAGDQFDSESLAGRVWVGSVFFANCPGPCFRENQAIADILREIDDPSLVAVSLTCDPENDTPEVLRRYADRFDADLTRWKFLTGEMATIKLVANDAFRLPAEVGVHSERGVVFDRQGRLRGGYHLLQPDRVELLKKLIREVLAEEPPPGGAEGAVPAGPVGAAAVGGGMP